MILFEDEFLIAAEKRPGEICEEGENSVLNRLKKEASGAKFLQCVNRIDRPVFGVFLAAKSRSAMEKMSLAFSRGEVKKSYAAIVEGVFETSGWQTAEDRLLFSRKTQKSYIDGKKGALAKTMFRVLGHCEKFSFVEARPLTGKTHQIRAQLSSRGLAIKGDLKYGAKRSDKDFPVRLFSRKVEFVHPFSGKAVHVAAEFPKDDSLWRLCAECFAQFAEE